MNVGIDIDGVLFPWDDAARAALRLKYGGERIAPSTSWNYLKEQMPRDRWDWLWSAEGQALVFGQVRTYPGVVPAFNALLRDPERRCHFVTHRDPRRTVVHTAAFLDRYFGGHPWAGVHVIRNATPKHSLAQWDVFIDDKPETVYDMLAWTDAQVFAPARPWNTELGDLRNPRLVRYDDPWTIVKWFEGAS